MPRLPTSIQQFAKQQKTLPADELWKDGRDEYRSAYGSYWYRAIACMLLSGRIAPKTNGDPNRTDGAGDFGRGFMSEALRQRALTWLQEQAIARLGKEAKP